jgi:hypothetical protein
MTYPLDTTGNALQNKVLGESAPLDMIADHVHLIVVPFYAPFYTEGVSIKYTSLEGVSRILDPELDYRFGFQYVDATSKSNRLICGCIDLVDVTLTGTLLFNYQTLGGTYVQFPTVIETIQLNEMRDPQFTSWEQVITARGLQLPVFPVVDHPWARVNVDLVKRATDELEQAGLVVHLRPKFLPTPTSAVYIPSAAEVGLGNLDNFKTATHDEAIAGVVSNRYMTPSATHASVSAAVDAQLGARGYLVAVPYIAGLVIENPLATYEYDGSVYAPRQSTLPFTTSGRFEKNNFIVINSNTRNAWIHTPLAILGNENSGHTGGKKLDTGLTISSRVDSRAILNNVVELVFNIDYHLDNNMLILEYPVIAGDKIDLYTKELKSRMADDRNYYKTFKVTDGSGLYYLTDTDYVQADDLRVTLNDFLVLSKDVDYTISGNVLTVMYKLKLGDLLEVENTDNVPFLGKQQVRNLLLTSKSLTH